MNKRLIIAIGIIMGCQLSSFSQQVKPRVSVPVGFCISQQEMKLHKMINDYRKRYDIPPVPLSKSLCYVAATHLKDLFFHHPDQEPCNSHSWSDKGFWKPFCYPGDENKKNSVWDKPREMTKYPGKGYEIIYWENTQVLMDSVLVLWKSVDYFKSFLLNTGKWQGRKWNAIGIAIFENYACAWFGEVADPEGIPAVCGAEPDKPTADTARSKKMAKTDQDRPEQPKLIIEPTQNPIGKYYIIVRTNILPDAANKLITSLKEKGYQDAKVMIKDHKIRISVFESFNKAEVMQKLKVIRKSFPDAWLLKN